MTPCRRSRWSTSDTVRSETPNPREDSADLMNESPEFPVVNEKRVLVRIVDTAGDYLRRLDGYLPVRNAVAPAATPGGSAHNEDGGRLVACFGRVTLSVVH